MIVTRAISLTNFVVASSALGFQIFVLYPWHKELDAGFEELKKEHLRVLSTVGGNGIGGIGQGQTVTEKLADMGQRRWWFQSTK
jgi:hypothetical protein